MPVEPKTITAHQARDRMKLLAYIGSIVRDHHIAEDVLQEVRCWRWRSMIRSRRGHAARLVATAARFRSLKARSE